MLSCLIVEGRIVIEVGPTAEISRILVKHVGSTFAKRCKSALDRNSKVPGGVAGCYAVKGTISNIVPHTAHQDYVNYTLWRDIE